MPGQTLLDRIEAEGAAGMVAGGEGHVGLQHKVLCEKPTPVTWFTDADGNTWVVAHLRHDPDGRLPEGILLNLGFTVFPNCPMVGEPLGWCCCYASRRGKEPSVEEARRLAAEYTSAMSEVARQWEQMLHGAGGLLRAAHRVTGEPGEIHFGAGTYDGKPRWHTTYRPTR